MHSIRKILISMFIGLLTVTSVMGQTDLFHNLTIDAVTAAYDAETGLVLTLSITIPDGCEPLLEVTQHFGDSSNVWLYDVRRNAVPRDTPCASEPLTTSLDIEAQWQYLRAVLETPDYNEVYLIFNDAVYYRLSVMTEKRQEGEQTVMARTLGNLQPMERRDMLIRSAEIQTVSPIPGDNTLLLLAGASDGCRAQIITRIWVDDTTLNVSVFRLLEVRAVCPAVMRPPSELRVPIPMTDQNEALIKGSYQIAVNDYPMFEYEFVWGDSSTGGETQVRQSNVVVDSAEVLIQESMPPQVSIVVRGNLPDGCNVALKEARTQDGNTITIRLYRELMPDLMCTMVITPYEHVITLGAMELGDYTVSINGYTITFNL